MDSEEKRIDPDLWLQVLLPQLGDPEEKRKLIEEMSRKSGVSVEKTEEIFRLLAQTLLEIQRSN